MKRIKYVLIVSLMAICSSCSSFLEEYSQDLKRVESWTDLDELLLGDGYLQSGTIYVGAYSALYFTGTIDNLSCLHMMSDEMEARLAYSTDNGLGYASSMFGFHMWQHDTGLNQKGEYVGGDDWYWNNLYARINTANMVLSVVDEQPEASDEDRMGKERVKGEAYFLRAAYYFVLANLYGKPYTPATAASTPAVPIKTSEMIEDKEYVRNSVAEVYTQILNDLGEAEKLLAGKTRKSIYHANLTATYLLKARVYLYMQDWANAATYAQKALDEQDGLLNLSSLVKGEDALFKNSPETIFSMGGYMIAYCFADNSYGYEPEFFISPEIAALYKENDWRSEHYIGGTKNAGHTPVFQKVHSQRDDYGAFGEVSDCFLMRTPEAYLILAEASAMNKDENTARATLKKFLATRMKTAVDVTYTGKELIDFIRDERAREFLVEGHRWFDLRRYTVYETYPYSKTIEHRYTEFAYKNFSYNPTFTEYYRLEENDAAYTLPIPRSVRNFQNSIGNNERPKREPFKTVTY